MENRITRLELRRSRVLEGGSAADLKGGTSMRVEVDKLVVLCIA